jgi:hypothetical protein
MKMKKVFVMVALAIAGFANAQEGTILVAGNVGYFSKTTGDFKASTFEFAPKVGYQFSKNTTIGIESAFVNTNFDDNDAAKDFKLGAFLRYSQPLAGVFSVFADFSVGMQSSKYEEEMLGGSATLVTKADGFYLGVVPAIGIDLNKGFLLNFSIGGLGYDSMKWDGASDATNTFGITFGKQVNFGISKNF